METYESQMARLEELIVLINKTNATSLLEDVNISITDAIAKRDCIRSKMRCYKELHNATSIQQERYARNEVRYVRCISPKYIQQKIDSLAKAYRELDTKIQTANWNTTIVMEVNSDITPINADNYYGR
jgi:predicted GTPase